MITAETDLSTSVDLTKSYYESNATEYFRQTCDRHLEPYWSTLESSIKAGSLILDLGCGSGRDLKHFASAGHQAVGIDYSLPLIKLASSFSGQPTILGDLRLLPIRSAAFDAAWAMASLLHQPRATINETLIQIRDSLKPNAPFFAAMKLGRGEGVDSLGRFNSYYSEDEWADALQQAGFAVGELQVTMERRSLKGGTWQEIPWISSLASSSSRATVMRTR